ncbi:hypothetical protein SAMN02982929_06320 [Saccharopolyspora kobensis]|uniref:Uncharacterized protein n=1 Tax=Saccharopolyspora kobensis TaxID=146035 RepID=A0A1H6EEA6_9PSEU|nr:hypothetical protein [Saccharopolyspora kobensis]SEG96157.1 hypothetical protein SAMN02982929_06320 [Saccharopolyspora kobensis]SFD21802.1 hypothetical protein SAMN05216506_103106 [Saccharopolyspora kobensis]
MSRYVLERVQLSAQNHPKRHAAVSCAIGGLLVAATSALSVIQRSETVSWPAVIAVAVIGGGAWAAAMAVFVVRLQRRMKPLPPETDPARVRAARRLMRNGELGPDPETNALAVRMAEQLQSIPRWKKFTTTAFLCTTILGVLVTAPAISDGEVGKSVFYGACTLFPLLMLTVGRARLDRHHRNAAEIRRAAEHRTNTEAER